MSARTNSPRRRGAVIAALLLVCAFGGWQLVVIDRVSFNWDELVMLRETVERVGSYARSRASRRAARERGARDVRRRFGDTVTAAHIPLASLARRCRNPAVTLARARRRWLGFTLVALLGLFALLLAVARRYDEALVAAAAPSSAGEGDASSSARALPPPLLFVLFGLAAWVLMPMFLRWSVHVRIDQPALAAAFAGGVALLLSRRLAPLALLAGALFTIAALCGGRAAIAVGLAVLLVEAEGRLAPRSAHAARRRRVAMGLAAVGALATLWVMLPDLALDISRPFAPTRASGIDLLFFGETYPRSADVLWPTIVPAAAVLVALLALSLWPSRAHDAAGAAAAAAGPRAAASRAERVMLGFAWGAVALAALGAAVFGLAPPASWLTLGACVGVAVALTLHVAFARLSLARARPSTQRMLVIGVALVLAVPAAPAALTLMLDMQREQRRSYAFITRVLAPLGLVGYQPEGGLTCVQPAHTEIFDKDTVDRRFAERDARAVTLGLLRRLRLRGVRYLLASFQYGGLPRPLRAALIKRFVRYRHDVLLPGTHLDDALPSKTFHAFVSGQYRFEVVPNHDRVAIEIDGRRLYDGDVVRLTAGKHHIVVDKAPVLGLLVLDVPSRYLPGRYSFYDRSELREYAGWAWGRAGAQRDVGF